ESSLPVEYKLLDYKPEAWSNLKIALFLKQMSKELAGFERDLEFTNAKQVFNVEEMKRLFPQFSDSSAPIIPKGTAFEKPAIVPVKPATADSLYFGKDTIIRVQEAFKPDRNNGSNNWAVNGSKTKSGAPILCNDPHLGLSLPSIWYEMQISTPEMNVYGASFPGTPNVIIGFNDSIAFGFTNAGRDVKDYYQIRFRDNSKKEYWYNGAWQPTKLRVEEIKARGGFCCYDTVAYTVFGPVMYDNSFTIDSNNHTALAVRWMAHDPSDEGLMWIRLDKAKNYHDFEEAIKVFKCPAQNMLFASASGDIAIWQQGQFPARWRGQGLYVMPGEDSSYRWQGFIPQEQNPHILNPTSGFIQSANQMPVDSAYPYFIPGHYFVPRGVTIANRLTQMQQITPQDMMLLQNDTHSSIAADAVPLLLRNLYEQNFSDKENYYLNMVKKWNYTYTPETQAPTVYQAWIDSLKSIIWKDEFAQIKGPKTLPDEQTLVEWLLRDTAMKFIDDIRTPEKETLPQQVTKAFRLAITGLNKEVNENELI
ncbi:MAG: penicillin acylase family protein, partial [Flavisolibacter sp.]|nr:penicillin acylase family protein [Flavisolibacter sp.]